MLNKDQFNDICNGFENYESYKEDTINELNKMSVLANKIIFDFAEILTRKTVKESNIFREYFYE